MRKWLNGAFFNNAFSVEEQKQILSTTVTTTDYSTVNTKDRVFLLSSAEAEKYFDSYSARQCQGTAYCYAQGADKANNGNCWWWLRSPGNNSNYAAFVDYDGCVYGSGYYVTYDENAVRPALWINLEP